MFCPNCKQSLDQKKPLGKYDCGNCGGSFEITRRIDLEADVAKRLFLAEVMKGGGPVDRIGDFLEGCSQEDACSFIKETLAELHGKIKDFWQGCQEEGSG